MKTVLFLSLISLTAMAQDMTAADNQCRTDAKEIAIKSYQSCLATARTARLEQIRKEYQEKLAELKKQYEGQLQELKKQNKNAPAAKKSETPSDKITEPTIVLKKAKSSPAKNTAQKSKPARTKNSNAPTIITEAELEKSALPVVEPVAANASSALPAANTGAPTAAPATESAPTVVYETNVNGETEDLQVIDPSLPVNAQ